MSSSAAGPDRSAPIRFLFALPGFHQEDRGAEVALLSVAQELARAGDAVTVIGAGPERPGMSYRYMQAKTVNRRKLEWLPQIPLFRSETAWEDAVFALRLMRTYRPRDFDVTITCSFPFTHWALRRGGKSRPLHLFVTQNGDWPAFSDEREFRYFDCDGLVCTNPDFEQRNRDCWRTVLIPNGIYPERYRGVTGDRGRFGIPQDRKVVLMVSALIETKRVADGIKSVAAVPGAHLVVAGDGPLRDQVNAAARDLLPGRFTWLTVPAEDMPALYRSADAFLHMSLQESFGNVYVEAMGSGLPIVAHDSHSMRWIVGKRETLCDTRDLSAVTAAISRALEIGQGAPDPRVEQFAWPAIAERYRAFAQTLLRERR